MGLLLMDGVFHVVRVPRSDDLSSNMDYVEPGAIFEKAIGVTEVDRIEQMSDPMPYSRRYATTRKRFFKRYKRMLPTEDGTYKFLLDDDSEASFIRVDDIDFQEDTFSANLPVIEP